MSYSRVMGLQRLRSSQRFQFHSIKPSLTFSTPRRTYAEPREKLNTKAPAPGSAEPASTNFTPYFLALLAGGLIFYFRPQRSAQYPAPSDVSPSRPDVPSYTPSTPFSISSSSPSSFLTLAQPALSLSQATAKLQSGEVEGQEGRGEETVSWYGVRHASNSPIEDYWVKDSREVEVDDEKAGRMKERFDIWGVFDGHVGTATAETLQRALVPYIHQALSTTPVSNLDPKSIDKSQDPTITALRNAFLRLDSDILAASLSSLSPSTPLSTALSLQAPAYSGSCAILSLYRPSTKDLHVACVGDSRAVLGRWNEATGTYSHQKLSIDQTGFNASEVARITAEHPGETDIVDPESGRTLGMAITRAFGDGLWKWPIDAVEKTRDGYWGKKVLSRYKTPPYLTAEPEVESVKVGKGDFVIMASDGVWDRVSSEVAVRCVGDWVEKKRKQELGQTVPRTVSGQAKEEQKKEEVARGTAEWGDWTCTPETFVFEDENPATHLVKNVFGGSSRGLFTAVMSVVPPKSRTVRDDVTVWVIFFGEVGVEKGGTKKIL